MTGWKGGRSGGRGWGGSCRPSCSTPSLSVVGSLGARWRQQGANYSTGHGTDESRARVRWLSMCRKKKQNTVCVCMQLCASLSSFVYEWKMRDVWAECHPDICQGSLCVCVWNKWNSPLKHLAATAHDECTVKCVILSLITIAACPDGRLWQRGVCAGVFIYLWEPAGAEHLTVWGHIWKERPFGQVVTTGDGGG